MRKKAAKIKQLSKGTPKDALDPLIAEIVHINQTRAITNILAPAFQFALNARFGHGLIRQAKVSQEEFEATFREVEPLAEIIRTEVMQIIKQSLATVLTDPVSKKYFSRRFASIEGKLGGRRPGRSPLALWLEDDIRKYESVHGRVTAGDHYKRLCQDSKEISGEDEVGLVLKDTSDSVTWIWETEFKYFASHITLGHIRKAITQARKK